MKICLIGNYAVGKNLFDGQRSKTRLYFNLLVKQGHEVILIDLFNIKRKFLRVLYSIKKQIEYCDVIVLMAANRGASFLIPFINKLNKKYKKRFVVPLIGTSVLHQTLDKLTKEQCIDFFKNNNYSLLKPSKKLAKNLKLVSAILPETNKISETFRNYYGLDNVYTLTNFRDCEQSVTIKKNKKIIYLSRVMEEKGIFDLIDSFSSLNTDWELDIFGPIDLNRKNKKLFDDKIKENKNIHYLGIINQDDSIKVISEYSLFVFPTRFVSEGTPGVIVESLIAGTPIITSSFMQADQILTDGKNSIFYDMFNQKDLTKKLSLVINNEMLLNTLRKGSIMTGKEYLFSTNKELFNKYIIGD